MLTREEVLGLLAQGLVPLFSAIGLAYPEKLRLACGWPKGKARAGHALGQCWTDEASADGTTEIFITPAISDISVIAHVLVHELIHACVGIAEGHKGAFKSAALAIGLEGKMTSTTPTPELAAKLAAITATLPPYPHADLTAKSRTVTQPTRMIKLVCPDVACGWTCRTTQKWLDIGLPSCACGEELRQENAEGGDGDEGK